MSEPGSEPRPASELPPPGWIAQLRERQVFKVGAAYLVAGWVLIQVAATVMPQFDLPPGAPRLVTLLVALGLPLSLVLAWAVQWTPAGPRLDPAHGGSKRMALVAVVLAAAALTWYFLTPSHAPGPQAVAPAPLAPGTALPASLAVLPFADLSPERDQEYFSDGMAEEILIALAQVRGLDVAGRTASFRFKGRNEDPREIGRALGVAHLLEGSVRKQGQRVRISVQLIRSGDGFRLWSQTYDGDLADVFALQEQIARAITRELRVVLEDGQRARLVPVATTSPEAYALYLQATAVFNRRDGARFAQAIADLQEAVRLDPRFARAHARLAALYSIHANYAAVDQATAFAAGERAARQAIALDPTLAEPHAALGVIREYRREWLPARESFERALALDPDDVTTNLWAGMGYIDGGYVREGLARIDHALAVDPQHPNALAWRAYFHHDAGNDATARPMAQRAVDSGLMFGDTVLGLLAHAEGRDDAAVAHLTRGLPSLLPGFPDDAGATIAQGLYGDAAQRAKATAVLEAYLESDPDVVAAAVPWTLLLLEENARALAIAGEPRTANDTIFLAFLWSSRGRDARRDAAFPAFARRLRLTELWDAIGPPEGCVRIGPADYRCGGEDKPATSPSVARSTPRSTPGH